MKKILVSIALIALIAGLIGAGTFAWFTDTEKGQITTSNATVVIGATTGFPVVFTNLTPGVWADWKPVTINNASSIPADLYIGMHDNASTCSLVNNLAVQLQRNDGSWVTIYDADVGGLFTAWLKVAEDMPATATWSYQLRVKLDESFTNQGCTTDAWVLIHAVQYNGPAPAGAPGAATVP